MTSPSLGTSARLLLCAAAASAMTAGSAYAAPKPAPDMQAVLDAQASLGLKPIWTLTPAEARRQPTVADGVKVVLRQQGRPTAPDPAVATRDVTYPAPGGAQKARIYRPANAPRNGSPMPVIVYYHGGGWVIADIDTYDATPRTLSKNLNALVISVEYRHAPEHKFPAAHDDANAAYQWVVKSAAAWGGDPARIALAGESAGGNLAVNVAIAARDRGWPAPVHILSVYPVAGSDMNTTSYKENADAKPLNKPLMMWFVKYVTRSPADGQDPRINLVAADLHGLPPTTIITDQIDPLRSEGQLLGDRMRIAGDQVTVRNFDATTHEFFGTGLVTRSGQEAEQFATDQLTTAFGGR